MLELDSHTAPTEALEPTETTAPAAFTSLPTEIHIQIASILPYPDALALKHTNGHLYSLVKTDLELKVDWILERHRRGLAVPRRKCELRTDETFCKGEICNIMEKRRWHLECKPGMAGCLVVEGASCGGFSSFVFRLLTGNRLMRSITRKSIGAENRGESDVLLFRVCSPMGNLTVAVLLLGFLLCLITLIWGVAHDQWTK